MKGNTCVRLDDETKKKIEKIAINKRRKTSELIRIILEDYVKQFEDTNLFE